MAFTECANGHLYDTSQYTACPYCNGGGKVISFDGDNGESRTAPVGGGFGVPSGGGYDGLRTSIGRTEAGSGYFHADEAEKTVAPAAYRKRQEEENKTVGVFTKKNRFEPIVGWLVCVEGADKGKDYHLYARINTVGRNESMDICIKGDDTISRENHARIAYDPRHNTFQIIPAENINNIYLNDESLYVPAKLSAYDVIEFGNSKMYFVPFCCERFRWPEEAD